MLEVHHAAWPYGMRRANRKNTIQCARVGSLLSAAAQLLLLAAAALPCTSGQFQNNGGSAQLTFTGAGLQGYLQDMDVPTIIMGGALHMPGQLSCPGQH